MILCTDGEKERLIEKIKYNKTKLNNKNEKM